MKKRLLSILLCICMVMTLLPTMALATETTTYKPTEWSEVQNTIDSMRDGDILDLSEASRGMGATFDTLTVGKSITIQANHKTGRNKANMQHSAYNLRIKIQNGADVTLKTCISCLTNTLLIQTRATALSAVTAI